VRKLASNQSGFNIVEAIVVVAVVGVIGAAGWFAVLHNKAKPTNAAAGTGNHATTQQSNTTPTPPPSTTNYLVIKEWNVRVPYSGSLKLTYTMSSDDRTAYFSSDQLTALSSDCIGEGGRVVRYASTDKVSEGPADANTPTAQQAFANADPSTHGHVADYYYVFGHAQSGCGDVSTTAALQAQTNDAVQALVPKLQASPTN